MSRMWNFLKKFFEPKNIYRKPVIIRVSEENGIVGGHFDLESNDFFSVTTGYALPLAEINFFIVEHTAHGAPLPHGIKLDQLIESYNQVIAVLASASSDIFDLGRLPIWQGNSKSGPWEAATNITDSHTNSKPLIALEPDVQDNNSNEDSGEENNSIQESPFVKVTVVVNERPLERLAMRINLNWSDELPKTKSKNSDIYLPEDFEFLIQRSQNLEKTGNKVSLSSDELITFHADLVMQETKVIAGKKQMGHFSSIPGIYRKYTQESNATAMPST